MKRTFFILIAEILLIGCNPTKRIAYNTNDLSTSKTLIPKQVDVRILEDVRALNAENDILFTDKMQTKLNGKLSCINSEKGYKKDSVNS